MLGYRIDLMVPPRAYRYHAWVLEALARHGARPALLWECDRPVLLTCPSLGVGWSDRRPRGEALLPGPSTPSFA